MHDTADLPPLSHKRWCLRATPEPCAVASLNRKLGIHPTLATLLVQRGITSYDAAKQYFRPELTELHDPFIMKDMRKAIARLGDAITRKEKILIYGDYDVDGVTSVALLYSGLRHLGARLDFYIPDRQQEGYGISFSAIQWAARKGFTLIMSLDCGIRDFDSVQHAQASGLDVIVSDHHEPGEQLPSAYAIINPKQAVCPYPTQDLSGCGVGFKILQALSQQSRFSSLADVLFGYLDLVAISIACDIVPISDENRILAYHGLRRINTDPRPGIKALMRFGRSHQHWGISQLAFDLGPRINAAGRVGHAHVAVRLLLAEHLEEAIALAEQLDQHNVTRRDIDAKTTQEAFAMIQRNPSHGHAKTTVLFQPTWHKGVVGIVAARCVAQYYRPTIILTEANGKATGSARSVAGFNVYQALTACADLLEQYGGHAFAAGVTLPLAHLEAFQQRFESIVARSITQELLTPSQVVDLPLNFSAINFSFYNILRQMSPFGMGNLEAVFVTTNVLAKRYAILKDTHLKLHVYQQESPRILEAIGFGLAHYVHIVANHKPFRMAYTMQENSYRGRSTLQLNIKDIQAL